MFRVEKKSPTNLSIMLSYFMCVLDFSVDILQRRNGATIEKKEVNKIPMHNNFTVLKAHRIIIIIAS